MQMIEGNLVQTCSPIPVAEQETTREGDDEEDDCDHQFKLLIFVFVGKSVGRTRVEVVNQRGLKTV